VTFSISLRDSVSDDFFVLDDMLLIGSRAIVHFFPEFRPPRDWDLVGTAEDIARLGRALPVFKGRSADPARDKAYFDYGGVLVEVANASVVPYWARVLETFCDEPSMDEPVLGSLLIAPAPYLLLTKHCGLVYRIAHWHKNLEDLYFLRDRIPTIPDRIAALVSETLVDSARMFAPLHATTKQERSACHPELPPSRDPALHGELHRCLSLGATPATASPDAWQGFPDLQGDARREAMMKVLAEEAMVIGAEEFLRGNLAQTEDSITRWALRNLITGGLPDAWRYFGVNHYREIRSLVPEGWLDRIGALTRASRAFTSCTSDDGACVSPRFSSLLRTRR
jgi:hypothetical protein